MRFAVKTEEEVQNTGMILQPGVYQFQVENAENCVSKSGNEMIKLMLSVWDKSIQNPRSIFDYLLEAMPHKIRHFAATTGLMDKYEKGELNDMDCMGKFGHLELVIDKGRDKPEGGKYPDKNSVKDYVIMGDINVGVVKPSKPNRMDDYMSMDVPF